jgi:hypothetical protein
LSFSDVAVVVSHLMTATIGLEEEAVADGALIPAAAAVDGDPVVILVVGPHSIGVPVAAA